MAAATLLDGRFSFYYWLCPHVLHAATDQQAFQGAIPSIC